jgi:hypothetical protein
LPIDEFPQIQRATYTFVDHRIRFQLNFHRSSAITRDQWCVQYYYLPTSNIEIHHELPTCVPLTSLPTINHEFELTTVDDQSNVRLRLCLINQTDVCSKSIALPTGVSLSSDSSELILILIGNATCQA